MLKRSKAMVKKKNGNGKRMMKAKGGAKGGAGMTLASIRAMAKAKGYKLVKV